MQILKPCLPALALLATAAFAQSPLPANDPYRQWAESKWPVATVANESLRASTWGETADPDKDGYVNLQEYVFDTNPLARVPVDPVLWSATTIPGRLSMTFKARQGDPQLLILPQASGDLQYWHPPTPVALGAWSGDPANTFEQVSSAPTSGPYATVTFAASAPLSAARTLFTRVLVMRGAISAVTSPTDGLRFQEQIASAAGQVVESNTITPSGFTGTILISTTGGARLIVNGVDVGTSAQVSAGSEVRLRGTSPATGSGSYGVVINGTASTWTITTRPPEQPVPVAGTVSGYTPVSASVGENGAANISIPITVPPGTAGMEPKLAITYSSQAPNGLLGVGFSISGLSAISRSGPTQWHDGKRGGVSLTENPATNESADRFALDGQRLQITSGTWGAPGSTYRTEIDTFSRITALGDTNAGPLSWRVETKAGLTYEYGTTADSRSLASRASVPGDDAVLSWSVNRITDNAGNSMEFLYYPLESGESGHSRIHRIRYTRNSTAGLVPLSQVVFFYEDRPDVQRSYVVGAKVELKKRLKTVDSMFGAECVRRQTLIYQQSSSSSRSQIRAVEESIPYTLDPNSLWTTIIKWGDSNAIAFREPLKTSINGSLHSLANSEVLGDFDGDGRTDILSYNQPPQPSIKHYKLYLAKDNLIPNTDGDIFQNGIQTNVEPSSETSRTPVLTGDFNADGKLDLLMWDKPFSNQRYNFLPSNGTGFDAPIATNIEADADESRPTIPADFNGDGRTDLLVYNKPFNNGRYNLYLASANGFDSAISTDLKCWNGSLTENIHIGDFNGDGFPDALTWHEPFLNSRYNLSFGTGAGFSAAKPTPLKVWGNDVLRDIAADANGDGLTDMFIWHEPYLNRFYNLYISKGDGTFTDAVATPMSPSDGKQWRAKLTFDLNSDGLMDFLSWDVPFRTTNYYAKAHLGTGSNLDSGIASFIPSWDNSQVVNQVGDFDGDGRTDAMIWHTPFQNFRFNIYFSERATLDMVQGVTTGHGGYTKFAYKPLTDLSVYTKGTGAVYPCYDMQASLHVVSSITTRSGADGDAYTAVANPTPGETTTSYKYERAWMCLDGRGFRGFKGIVATREDPVTAARNIVSRTEYETENPVLAGRPTRELVTLGDGRKISETTNHWTPVITTNYTPPGATRASEAWFVYADSSESKEFEINGQTGANPPAVKTTTVSGVEYDAYGNLKHSLTDYGGGFSEEVTSDYDNDTTKWWLGRLRETTVTQRAPGQPDQTRTSRFEYSPVNGQVKKENIVTNTTALNLEKTYEFDGFGNIRQSTLRDMGTGETRTTITRYTPDGRFIAETENAYGHVESKTYDPLTGNTKTQTGPNNLTTTWEYDAFGRPAKEIRSDGTTSITQYLRCTPGVAGAPPRAVHCVRTQSAGGGVKMVYFDILDREIRQDATSFDGRTVSTHTVYDARGQATHVSQPFFSNAGTLTAPPADYTVSDYDEIGRVKTQTAPGNRVTSTAFNGLTATVTNPLNQTFTTQQDVRGRTGTATSYGTDAITNIHDPYGNLLEVRDGLGRTTTMRYDARGNKYEMREPNSGLTTYGYNAFGELTRQTDARGITVRLYYDNLGRLKQREEPEGTTVWEYDTAPNGIGKLARVSRSADGYEEVYRYDAQGRPVETLTRIGSMRFVTGTTYDEYSRPRLTIYPTGFAVRNVYNAQGFLSEVRDAATGALHWQAESINARGQVEEERYGNGLTGRRAYFPATGLVKDIQTGVRSGGIGSVFTGGGMRQNLAVEWDDIGNLKKRADLLRPSSAEDFTYDTRNRLETATGGGHAMTMTYETDGRIKTKALTSPVSGESYHWTYDYLDPAHPHAVTRVRNTSGNATVRTLGYDAAGNALTDGDVTLTYTSNNQPATIRKGSTTLAFSYTPGRARYRQTETTATGQTTKLYIGGLYEREDTAGTTVHTHFIAGGSGVIAIRTVTESIAGKQEKLRYVHRDHLGSLHTLTDETGAVSEVLNFDAWGKRRTLEFHSATSSFRWTYATTPSQTDRGFTGHEMLDAVGLVHMNGRIYDPTLGRFLSVDPIVQEAGNLQNLNRYSYVLNNPLSMTDPSGFFFKSIGKFLKKHWRTIAAVGIGILTGGAALWAGGYATGILAGSSAIFSGGLSIGASMLAGAGIGFGSAFSGTLLAGGSIGDALRAGVRGGIAGGIQAGLTAGAADAFGLHGVGKLDIASREFAEKVAIKIAAHGIIGGVMSSAQGGKFIHGFLPGALSGAASPFISRFGLGPQGRLAVAALVSGTAEDLGGGKFANGAVTGMAVYLFNEIGSSSQTEKDVQLNRNLLNECPANEPNSSSYTTLQKLSEWAGFSDYTTAYADDGQKAFRRPWYRSLFHKALATYEIPDPLNYGGCYECVYKNGVLYQGSGYGTYNFRCSWNPGHIEMDVKPWQTWGDPTVDLTRVKK